MHCAECYQLICVLIDILEFDCLRTVMRYNYHNITFHCPVTSLGPDDLNDVRRELLDVSKKWYDIGLELRLQPGDLENIECQNQDIRICLRKMLLHWLKKVDPPPTWERLACALESRTVGEPRLAEQLRTKYCKTPQAAGQ